MEPFKSSVSQIAHDINNLLTPILGYLDLALHELPESSPVRAHIEEARSAALKCADTISRFREVGQTTLEPTSGQSLQAPRGNELILLADDEESIRQMARTLLERLGYRVLVATDGDDAVERYRSTPGISLVILDVVMPRMGGQQALQKILEVDPAARVLISSGYMMNSKPEDFIRNGAKGFLKKPYLLESLAQLVRQTIDHHA